jgi:hypothetical protein
MSALDTVSDYVDDIRTLLQDTVAPFRYDDPSIITAFNVTLLETRRVRADLFVQHYKGRVPFFAEVGDQPVCIEEPFRLALVFGTASHAMARDQEDVQDARASSFMGVFYTILTGVKMRPIEGSTPPAPSASVGDV